MLSDAAVYALALFAIGRSALFKAHAARVSGWALLLLALGMLAEVGRSALGGSAPEGTAMIAVALMALAVNVVVLRLLAAQRSTEVHMRAAWIFTRADVVANVAVIISGLAVLLTGIRAFDLIVGAAIALYVMREAFEILGEAEGSAGQGRLIEARRAERGREQRRELHCAHFGRPDAEHVGVGPAQSGKFVEHLPAAPARRDRLGPRPGHRNRQQPAATTFRHRLAHRDRLGAQSEAEAGVLDIGPGHHRAVGEAQCRADREFRIGGIGAARRAARRFDQIDVLFSCHGCSTTQRTGSGLASLR